jgi:hypothetical protein
VHRENPSGSFEFLTPATTDNVETAKNFKLWTELNFLAGVELLRLTCIVKDTPRRTFSCRLRRNAGVTHCNRN